MLVLTRKKEEILRIGDDIAVTVIDVRGDKVRLGIAAPENVPVHRQEVYEAIQRKKLDAEKKGPQNCRLDVSV